MTKKPKLTTAARKQENLECRITNLEMALHRMWGMLRDALPPAHVASIDEMMLEHYRASAELGGLPKVEEEKSDENTTED